MKSKIFLAVLAISCTSILYANEPCGVYEDVVRPCAPIETVAPCEPVQACAPVETTIEPCAPVAACAPVADCFDCTGVKTVVREERMCRGVKVVFRPRLFDRVQIDATEKLTSSDRQCCLARFFARKNVSIERKVKIETN